MKNITKSFICSNAKAKPYHQPHARGVKLIGATAHDVTSDLDEGPIIEQAVGDPGKGSTSVIEAGRDMR